MHQRLYVSAHASLAAYRDKHKVGSCQCCLDVNLTLLCSLLQVAKAQHSTACPVSTATMTQQCRLPAAVVREMPLFCAAAWTESSFGTKSIPCDCLLAVDQSQHASISLCQNRGRVPTGKILRLACNAERACPQHASCCARTDQGAGLTRPTPGLPPAPRPRVSLLPIWTRLLVGRGLAAKACRQETCLKVSSHVVSCTLGALSRVVHSLLRSVQWRLHSQSAPSATLLISTRRGQGPGCKHSPVHLCSSRTSPRRSAGWPACG